MTSPSGVAVDEAATMEVQDHPGARGLGRFDEHGRLGAECHCSGMYLGRHVHLGHQRSESRADFLDRFSQRLTELFGSTITGSSLSAVAQALSQLHDRLEREQVGLPGRRSTAGR
ncbi:hypothetical protein [Nocardia sp. NPDC059239]|uniref:hypothetical protein n=1 Tax=unclassified Nocardia TaxID=2637762 RepID=UPI0036CFF907